MSALCIIIKRWNNIFKLEIGDLPVDVLINSTVGILSPCIHASNHPIVHFKPIIILFVITSQ